MRYSNCNLLEINIYTHACPFKNICIFFSDVRWELGNGERASDSSSLPIAFTHSHTHTLSLGTVHSRRFFGVIRQQIVTHTHSLTHYAEAKVEKRKCICCSYIEIIIIITITIIIAIHKHKHTHDEIGW